MPMYRMKCNNCKKTDEYLMAICETDVEIPCSKCKEPLTRENNRVFLSSDAPAIRGETVVRIQK